MEVLGDLLCRHEKNIKQKKEREWLKKVGCQNVPLSGDYAEYVPVGSGDRLCASPPSCCRRRCC